MQIINDPKVVQEIVLDLRSQGKTIGFVPTMGNLHQGHISLVEIARQKADIVVSSIFVNPMQFGPNEDFESYPRTLKDDSEKLEASGCDILFTPTEAAIYPEGKEIHTSVEVNRLTDKLCGKSRPGHFRGVTTIVNILFNIVQPHLAVFGKKDYQQYQIIKAMVNDLLMPIEIIGGEIVREKNGLAMSSRNGYLSQKELSQAAKLRQVILASAEKIKAKLSFNEIINEAISDLVNADFNVDYFEIISQKTLETATTNDKELLIAAAAWLGQPRLIDNLEITVE